MNNEIKLIIGIVIILLLFPLPITTEVSFNVDGNLDMIETIEKFMDDGRSYGWVVDDLKINNMNGRGYVRVWLPVIFHIWAILSI